MKEGKSFEISKYQVLEAYKRVKANHGAGGIDEMDFTEFEKDFKNNLYKLWNRMSSGSYFPLPVRGVEIPKRNGKKRLLGIPTITDRVAQMVVRMNFEPLVEPKFCSNSYGYRPGRSAIDAVGITRKRCWKMAWVIEFDIKGMFDNIDHELMMKAIQAHTDCKWILLYIERLLKAPIMMADGSSEERNSGIPQGGVISPVLANLFMHYTFDLWMERQYTQNHGVRYADDGVIHCRTKETAERLLEALKKRMVTCKLEIHPDKTRIVYCRSDRYPGRHEHESFDFLGYTFRRRLVKSENGKFFNSFTPAVSKSAGQNLKNKIRDIRQSNKILSLEKLAGIMNPILRGWSNYFSKFCASEARKVLNYVNHTLIRCIRFKYKTIKRSKAKAYRYLIRIAKAQPNLFYHWKMGIRPTVG
ncbi:RNA-directed DNA polymerase [Sporomusaceae bacterium BoRhaA]|uniref:group II intron reverse transcriptase/maturase n=1 Tax=Pelorhabdus rhamnosifermentans TaxID=2772457 RepID=UPI001C0631BC|nr:group II intron reverse transcriptase/maturase [Pelorhabdus rhamnosifermentans]MBU2702609.1 RNA-directed DNA polymerase [Pelorhabdus rhamnosifermentans]